MFKTFNMGWGFGIIVAKQDQDTALDALKKAGEAPEVIGKVTATPQVAVRYKSKTLVLA